MITAVETPARARALMIQGTSSHAGKSTLVAALCRLFARAGHRVAPFKAQNMSNNAAVTLDGGEVGRAQAVQAMAAGIPVTVDMNPVLLKPQSDRTSQVVVLGRATRAFDARAYYDRTAQLWPVVTGALDRLRAAYDVVIIEGAGSPAEINLERWDIVNMRVARHADAPVLLVGDIERGGVFASLFGTVALLPQPDRARIRGFVINKFRGDPSLLDPGFDILRERTGIPTLGVLPYLDLSRLPEEDAVDLEVPRSAQGDASDEVRIDVVVVRLPHIANADEFQPLAATPGVRMRYVAWGAEVGSPDLVILPGTKSTLSDLAWLRERGLADAIVRLRTLGTPILGICGGFQMLGSRIVDEMGVEARGEEPGLGLLPVRAVFEPEKITRRVTARCGGSTALWSPVADALHAYEIHMGRLTIDDDASLGSAPFFMTSPDGELPDGASSADGLVVGTYLHGVLENDAMRAALVARLAARKGMAWMPSAAQTVDDAFDRLADVVAAHLDLDAIGEMLGLSLAART